VRFLIAYFARSNARRVAHPQLVPQLSHQPLEPIRWKRRFDPHHRSPRKLRVELFHFLALVLQPPLLDLPRPLLDPGHHLVSRVHITSDKMLHGFGSFPGSPWSLSTSKSTGLEPMPLSNQTAAFAVRVISRHDVTNCCSV